MAKNKPRWKDLPFLGTLCKTVKTAWQFPMKCVSILEKEERKRKNRITSNHKGS